jgi:3-oxoacyl-[acyl-carrier-protein] synthase-1
VSVFIGPTNIISPLGYTTRENFDALLQDKMGVKQQHFSFSEAPFCCSKLDDTLIEEHFSTLSSSTEYTQLEKMCILSIQDVVSQSGVNLKDKESLLIISTTKGNIDVLEGAYKNIDPKRAYLSAFAKTIGDYFNSVNTPVLVSNACISGLLTIIIGKRYIESGLYKNVIVCGGDIISEFTLSGFKSFNALSDAPSKPFDKSRVGINLGEAASSVLLSASQSSDIKILAGSSANDANHISGPSRTGDGLFQAISNTLADAGVSSVDYISAHGTATEYNDEMESIAFSRAGLQATPLNSLKGYYGHTLGAAGVLESVIAIESLCSNMLIRSAGFEQTGTSKELNLIKTTEAKALRSFLKTASGFGGCNAAAVFEKI